MSAPLKLVATCASGLEGLLTEEVRGLGFEPRSSVGAVSFQGTMEDAWTAVCWLRTANRVLLELGGWSASKEEDLYQGAFSTVWRRRDGLFDPDRSISIRATSSASRIVDARYAALKAKDGIVDAQRKRHERRSDVDPQEPDLPLRLRLHRDRATLHLDLTGRPMDHRGYRLETVVAPARETLAAACALASGWDGHGAIWDPFCGSGTLIAEAGAWARGLSPVRLRHDFALQKLPDFDLAKFQGIRDRVVPGIAPDAPLFGSDGNVEALHAAKINMKEAGLPVRLARKHALKHDPPAPGGLLLGNPPHGVRLNEAKEQWRRLGERIRELPGWHVVLLTGGEDMGRSLGIEPDFALNVRNGALASRILVFPRP